MRFCDDPKPVYGGKPCARASEGGNEDLRPDCNPDPCPGKLEIKTVGTTKKLVRPIQFETKDLIAF